ncbi:MAG: methyltransferase [Bacteroidota bacterium]
MIRDSFYTPKILADKLVSFSKKRHFNSVADFCVGDGELLRSAKLKWPEIKCFGSDISEDAIKATGEVHPDWALSQMDFLDDNSRYKSKILNTQPLYELILLNPPFSCIGGTIHTVEFDGEQFPASTAMKFLVTALKYLEKTGALYAILPTSIAYSQKDSKLWNALEKKLNLSILEEPKRKYFKDCAPNVILVSLNDFSQESKYKNITRISLDFEDVSVFRGKVSMNLISNPAGTKFLIHSTNIRNNELVNLSIKLDKKLSEITGPAILMPRVGKPKPSKMCIIYSNETYVLSDCIIAIKFKNIKETKLLYRYILNNWELIEDMFKGTGARYITLDKINQFLNLDVIKSEYQKIEAI